MRLTKYATRFGRHLNWLRKIKSKTAFRTIGLARKKFGYLKKIDGALELQKICKSFGIAFEPAIDIGQSVKGLRVRDLANAKRIIVRGPTERREFVVENLPKDKLAEVIRQIGLFISGHQGKFIVQKVGLREEVKSSGRVSLRRWLHEGQIKYQVWFDEVPYDKQQKTASDVFLLTGKNQLDAKYLTLEEGKFDGKRAKVINNKIGNQRASKMFEYLLSRLKDNTEANLKFVRYGGSELKFYSMYTAKIH